MAGKNLKTVRVFPRKFGSGPSECYGYAFDFNVGEPDSSDTYLQVEFEKQGYQHLKSLMEVCMQIITGDEMKLYMCEISQ